LSGRRRIRQGWLRAGVGLASAIVVTTLLAGCGTPTNPFPTPTPTFTPPASSPSASPAVLDLKPLLRGLLDRDGLPPTSYIKSLAGYVVNVDWSQLQPLSGGAIAPDNPIDEAITQVRAINAANHTHLGLKLRIYAGVFAPSWVKSLGGPPVPVTNPQGGQTGTIGRFWTDAFGQAYDQLETLLAAQYDQVPEVREVTISRCTTFYDEPFIRDVADPATVSALIGAGYTLEADETCQSQEIDAATVWRHTHSDLALNPYQVINPDGSTSTDEPFTDQMMAYCRQVLGPACVLENNSLRVPVQPEYQTMYEQMETLGQPIAFQTATEARIGNLQATLQYAVTLGANSVELPGSYQTLATPSDFTATNDQLAAAPTTAPPAF
jgi:hypothetical protein